VAKNSPPQRRENLGPLKWGLRGFGRRGRLWAKLPHEDLVCAAGGGGGFGERRAFLGEAIHCQRAEKKLLGKLDIFFNELGGYFETRNRGAGITQF
jgi:hypothetical protein